MLFDNIILFENILSNFGVIHVLFSSLFKVSPKSPLVLFFSFWRFVYSCPAAFIKYLRSDYYHHFHIELRALNAFILSYLHQYYDFISSQSHAPLSLRVCSCFEWKFFISAVYLFLDQFHLINVQFFKSKPIKIDL